MLSEWTRAGFEAYSQASFWQAPRAVDRLFGYVDFTIDLSRHAPIGCLVGTFTQGASASESNLRGLCQRAFQEWGAGLATLLDAAQQEAEVVPRFDSASVADHFVTVFEGAQVLAKSRQDRTVVGRQLLHFRAYLQSLLGLPSPPSSKAMKDRRVRRQNQEKTMTRRPKPRPTSARTVRTPADNDDPDFAPLMRAFARREGVEPTRMFGSVGLRVGGKVFAMSVKGRLVVKLPKERVAAMVASGGGAHFDPGHGKLMREWLAVERGGSSWLELAKEAHAFVKGAAR